MTRHRKRRRLVVVSNRLPFVISRAADGTLVSRPGSGGLVTALLPVLRDRGGVWVGWPGIADRDGDVDAALATATGKAGYQLAPVALSAQEQAGFYYGFSNEVLWPLFHDLHSLCIFDPEFWRVYCEVNRKYAQVVLENTHGDDFVWVHDYQLLMLGSELRHAGLDTPLGFFLHIPFPPLDIYLKLPWRFTLLRALLEFDLIGFQTLRDQRNFTDCVRTLLPEAGFTHRGQMVQIGDRQVRVGCFPIGIDAAAFERQAHSEQVAADAAALHAQVNHRELLLGVDRLDYTKGIPLRLEAFRTALRKYPDLQERVTLIQVVVPSRDDIPQYRDLKIRIEQLVGEINGEFTRPGGWVPIHYVYRALDRLKLIAYYRAAQIALVTPLKDGMNLVAKEFCASSVKRTGVLILSEFAGAAAQLQHGALLVNPYDLDGTADAIHRACLLPAAERRRRMGLMRRNVRRQDVFRWVNRFLEAAFAHDLDAFPLPDDYVPSAEAEHAYWSTELD
ncbi:MAG TPA: trehalose-6-phosphate synthase [Gammaproteobacteria bacterium]|nr:trehalose-6-phosphate synthase [Gammaproteobacteria bacterium]MCH78326.1 trehalose-6-phosphate synthase [Gammaproteobacteria bacterium]